MQHLTREEFLEVLGMTGGAFDQLQHAGYVALAFQTPMPSTPGRYLDLDLVAMAINLGLTPSLGRENATAIVFGFFDQWASAVAHAEANMKQDYFMAVGGVGWDSEKKSAKSLVVTNGTIVDIGPDFGKIPDLVGFFTVNISDIIRRLRARAHTAGIDLTRPFFYPPNDPQFNEILTRVNRERALRLARLKKDKKKFASVNARSRRQDIKAADRVKKSNYRFEMQGIG